MNMQDLPAITSSIVIMGMALYGLVVMFPALFSAFVVMFMPICIIIVAGCGCWHYFFAEDYGPPEDTRKIQELLPVPLPPGRQGVVSALQEEHIEAPRSERQGDKKTNITYNINDSVAIIRDVFKGKEAGD